MENKIQYINPDGLIKNPAFTQVVVTEGKGKTIYIGGQNAVNDKGEIIGKNDIKAQSEQVMKNLLSALNSVGANPQNIIKWTIYIVQGQNALTVFEAAQKIFSYKENPPVISVIYVAGLANPGFLLEIEAVAFLPA